MKYNDDKPEILLEGGMIVTASGLVWAVGMLLLGRSVHMAKQRRSRSELPPAPGSVPKNRHENISNVSAR